MKDRDAIAAAAAIVHIQQLAINYAVGVDQRYIDLVAEQFVSDVACGHWGTGRALKRMYHEGDATMDLSIHRVSNDKVDLVDDDHATGIVYLTADHRQHDGTWAYLAGAYHDRYERIDGRWLIQDRKLLFWFRDRVRVSAVDPPRNGLPGVRQVAEPPRRLAFVGAVLGRRRRRGPDGASERPAWRRVVRLIGLHTGWSR